MKENASKPYLSWTKQDFIDHNQEVPEKLLIDDVHTEGELMTNDEIVQWITDTEKTFCIIKEQSESMFKKLYEDYKLDLEYLVEIGKIEKDVIDNILDNDNFHF